MPSGWDETRVTRRRALAWAGGVGLAALLPGCGDDGAGGSGSEAAAPTGTDGAATPDCVLTPELTEGPYYLDLNLVRADITDGKQGTPLALAVTVVDADTCAPIADAAVDVWHCDAGGAYSGVEGEGGSFLRGIQMTNAEGRAEFRTIYPGWYSGRAVHIHVKVRVDGAEAHTGQLFFDDADTAAVYEREPYVSRPGPDVSNAEDGIFGQSGGSTIVGLERDGNGYAGSVRLGVRRA